MTFYVSLNYLVLLNNILFNRLLDWSIYFWAT